MTLAGHQLEKKRNTQNLTEFENSLSDLPSEFLRFRGEAAGLPVGTSGKDAVIDLTFERYGDKTHLVDHYDKMPAKVLRSIYYDPELPGLPYVLLLNPSGGTLQGDRYSYKFRLGKYAHAFLADTEATKIYKMDGNYASRNTEVYLGENSVLEYISREVIAYARSRWYQNTIFTVSEGSKFFFTEIFCPGRIAMNEFWDFDVFASKFIVENASDKKPILLDSLLFSKRDKRFVDLLFGKAKFLLSAYWYSGNAEREKESTRNLLKIIGTRGTSDPFIGVTGMPYNRGLIVKGLSRDLEALKKIQLLMWSHFRRIEFGTTAPDLRMY